MALCEYITFQNPTTDKLGQFGPTVYSLRQQLNKHLKSGEIGIENFRAIILGVDNGHVIGYCAAKPSVHNDGSWRLAEIMVDKNYRDKKYGEILVDRIISESKSQGAIALTATALTSSQEIVGHILTSRGFVTHDSKNFLLNFPT